MKNLTITCLIFIAVFTVQAQESKSQNERPLNIGFVSYTKTKTPGTFIARWNYSNRSWGPGIAIGKSIDNGFEGEYHVRYYYEDGRFSDEYDLEIRQNGDFYDVTWRVEDKVAARGVGMEMENSLTVGWRRVNE
jgi:hypothetical protein